MGLFSRKKPKVEEVKQEKPDEITRDKNDITNVERLNNLVDDVRDITENDKSISIMMVVSTSEGGSTLIQGNAGDLEKALVASARSNDHFAMLLQLVTAKLDKEDNRPMNKLFEGIESRRSKNVDLPNGDKGLAINAKDIENITDEEIDDIVNNMIKGMRSDDDDS
tara:strand:- start:207 stop:704 length:498 start_codon:yes stop_codon:yes gene_type:complete